MKNTQFTVASLGLIVVAGLTVGVSNVSSESPSQAQGSVATTPDQVEAIHSKLFTGQSAYTIPEVLAKAKGTGTIYMPYVSHEGEGPGPSDPSDYKDFKLRQLVCYADLVVVGRAGTGTSHMSADKRLIYSDWGFYVEQVLKDNTKAPVRSGTSIIVARPGGTLVVNGRTVSTIDENFNDFRSGEQYLLFINFIPTTGAYIAALGSGYGFSGTKTMRFTKDSYHPELESQDKATLLKSTERAVSAASNGQRCVGGASK
jgi:hypothetical protein